MSEIDDLDEFSWLDEKEIGPYKSRDLQYRERAARQRPDAVFRNHNRDAQIVSRFREGQTQASLADTFGLSIHTIRYILRKWKVTEFK